MLELLKRIMHFLTLHDNKQTQIPWEHALYKPKERAEYDGKEWPVVKLLRDKELTKAAPFSHRALIKYHNHSTEDFQCPIQFDRYHGATNEYYGSVPVLQILGADTTDNMGAFEEGMTFRQVLFELLHGAGLDQLTLDFYASDLRKDTAVPHEIVNKDPKTRSTGEWSFIRFGDWYFSQHGHQRTVLAMYYLWQAEGENAVIKNVHIYEYLPGKRDPKLDDIISLARTVTSNVAINQDESNVA